MNHLCEFSKAVAACGSFTHYSFVPAMAREPMAEMRRRVPAKGEGDAMLKMLGAMM